MRPYPAVLARLLDQGSIVGVTSCLEGRFTQRVNLHVPRSEAVRGARE
jgi:hypothetical protein